MAFTSDLTTSDFWLLKNLGYEPIALVVGNSVYSMGIVGGLATGLKGMTKGELPQITELLYNAREMALSRMKDEAEKLGADGVIGVKLKIEYMHGGEWMEITAVGTAVKYTGKPNPNASSPIIMMQSNSVMPPTSQSTQIP
ncbi:MAG: YbjQ family protein [Candidatus Micrarchaeia archaeon]